MLNQPSGQIMLQTGICFSKHHLELVHTIDDTMLEGKCCQSTEPMPCVPTLEKACRGFMCSVGMAGPGLFKLGCSQTEDFQVGFLNRIGIISF